MVLALVLTQYMGGYGADQPRGPDATGRAREERRHQFLVLMILYGVFIPNDPKTTASMVLTMALGPLVVIAVLAARRPGRRSCPMNWRSISSRSAIRSSLLLSAALAIYSAYVLNHLRRDLHQAKKLGQYQLGEKLGEGGMGEVYLAEHQLLKRPCALKLIKPDVNTNPIALARFEREVQSAAMLSHPNTIEIFDYGHTDDGTFYYVMEYLPGLSVSDLVRQSGPMPPGRVVFLMRQVCGSLAEAHRYGLVHRDLKPANILVAILGGKCDVAKVLDFGLVKLTATPDAPQLTADYTVSGTPQYMSPEQATADRGHRRPGRHLLAGRHPLLHADGASPVRGDQPDRADDRPRARSRGAAVAPPARDPRRPGSRRDALPRQEGRRPLSRRPVPRRRPGEPAPVRATGTTRRPTSGGSIRRRPRSRKLPPRWKPPLRLDRLQRLRLPGPVDGRPRRVRPSSLEKSVETGLSTLLSTLYPSIVTRRSLWACTVVKDVCAPVLASVSACGTVHESGDASQIRRRILRFGSEDARSKKKSARKASR